MRQSYLGEKAQFFEAQNHSGRYTLQKLPEPQDHISITISWDSYLINYRGIEEFGFDCFTDDGHTFFCLQYFIGSHHCRQWYDFLTSDVRKQAIESHLENMEFQLLESEKIDVEDYSRYENNTMLMDGTTINEDSRAIVPLGNREVVLPVSQNIAISEKLLPKMMLDSLEIIRCEMADCQRCKLGITRKNLVFGVGNPKTRLVFVGDGPGADEDAKGEPFVGAAGQILSRLITNMGLKREEVYICNVVKCRPPGNRDPEPDEIAACSPFLLRQLRSINPDVIVALGKTASQTLLGTKDAISRLRGKFHDFHGIPLMPTYHPSFLLFLFRKTVDGGADGASNYFWELWDDMTKVLGLLKMPIPVKKRKNSRAKYRYKHQRKAVF
jgi:DNA polymerase